MSDNKKQPVYIIKQFNSDKEVIARTETQSPVIAICDFAIKTKLHITRWSDIIINSQQLRNETPYDEEIRMIAVISDRETKDINSIVAIETKFFESGSQISNSISSDTVKRFKSPSYIGALQEVASTMLKLSGGNTEIMKIVAVIASKDASHQLWNPKKPSTKKLCLG